MRMLAPAGEVYQAGTLSGNPLAVAAGLATLALLDEPAYLRLGAFTEQLADGPARGAAAGPSGPGRRACPGLLTVFFSERPVRDFDDAQALRPRGLCGLVSGAARARRVSAAVAVRGLVPVAGSHAGALERTLAAAAAAFAELP